MHCITSSRFAPIFLIFPLLSLFVMACSDQTSDPEIPVDPYRGRLISSDIANEYTATFISGLLNSNGYDFDTVYAVKIYRVKYQTTTVDGEFTTASGIVAIPSLSAAALPLLSYQHGTILKRQLAPSIQRQDFVGIGVASQGYVVSIPDYLGLGSSEGLHPYVHASSLASASVDMIRATREFAISKSITLQDSLYLMGYSEGGYATMALHRDIQNNHQGEFQIKASAPMAGPYDLSGIMKDSLLSDSPHPSPGYVPYVFLAYNRIYNLYSDLTEVFVSPYNSTLPSLFNGETALQDINSQLPATPKDMFKESFVADVLTNPNNPFVLKLKENDLYDWKPEAPMYLLHSREDDQVPYLNTIKAYNRFVANGATDIQIDTSNEGTHSTASRVLFPRALEWFAQFNAH